MKKMEKMRLKKKRSRVSWICGVKEYGVMTRIKASSSSTFLFSPLFF
jgi:hypothetical protein